MNTCDIIFNVIELLFSGALVFATIKYTKATKMMYKESRETRLQKTNPCIIPFLKSSADHQSVFLYIQNVGEGTAKNVKVTINKGYEKSIKSLNLDGYKLFREGVAIYPPQYELHFLINTWDNIEKTDYIDLSIDYEGLDNRKFSQDHIRLTIWDSYHSWSGVPEETLDQIPYYLKTINNTLKQHKHKIEQRKPNYPS
ncbi:MAG: hypothetical protein J6X86_04410 [Bacteroidales bacterium]|nr:hypothetical protein [Bacteroidales bacterium]